MSRWTRVAAMGALVLLVQVALMPHLRLAGVVPDLPLLFALAVAYHVGPEAGVVTGFALGLGYDVFLETPLGLNALTDAVTAHTVGVLQTGFLRTPRLVAPIMGVVGGMFGGLLFAAVGIIAGVDVLLQARTLAVIGIAALYDGLLAPFVFAPVGWLARADGAVTRVVR